MTILLFTNDLMFQSRIRSVAVSIGQELVVARTIEAVRDRALTPGSVHLVVFDLSLTGIDIAEAVEDLRTSHAGIKSVAFGAHVNVDALQAAQDAGVDSVMTRGQFDRDMNQVLSQ